MKQVLILSFASLLLFGCSNKSKTVVSEKKPNIIFILTDDQRWDALGYAGNKLAYTPEMESWQKKVSSLKIQLQQPQFVLQVGHRY